MKGSLRIIFIFIFYVLIQNNLFAHEPISIAVMNFKADKIKKSITTAIEEKVEYYFFKSNHFTIVERNQINLAAERIRRKKTFQNIIPLPVYYVVRGYVRRTNPLSLEIKIINARTGNIVISETGEIDTENKFDESIEKIVKSITKRFFKKNLEYFRRFNHKNPFYVGFGFGSGYIFSSPSSLDGPIARDDTIFIFSINFGTGITINNYINIGLDFTLISHFYKEADFDLPFSVPEKATKNNIQITNIIALLTYFPFKKGFFTKTGIGPAIFSYCKDYSKLEGGKVFPGISILMGFGYDFVVKRHFNICLNLDFSMQFYDKDANPTEKSLYFNGYVSFYWF